MGDDFHPRRRPLQRSAALASFLSFLLPGLGQMFAGAWRRGLLLLVPALVFVGGAAAIWLIDRQQLVRIALNPTLLLVVAALSLALLLYRAVAIVDAYLMNRSPTAGRRDPYGRSRRTHPLAASASLGVLILLLAITTYMHGWVAYVAWSASDTLNAIFDPNAPPVGQNPTLTPAGSPANGESTPPSPEATPAPTPEWAKDGRLNVLLLGSDAGPGRWSMRPDAIILVSIDIATGRVAAFSVPRYTRNVPLPEPAADAVKCRCLSDDWFNALYVYANQHPNLFPGEGETEHGLTIRGLNAMSGASEALFGVHLDGMVVANLNGFIKVVDAMGGIDINIPEPVYDSHYPNPDGSGNMEIYFKAGEQHLDGWHALAYGRTRHQDSDVGRMRRQQQVISAIQRKLSCDIVGKLPALLEVARDTLWTNLPLEDVPDMIRIDPGPVESHLLFNDYNVHLTPKDVARVQAEVAGAFDGPAPTPKPKSSNTPNAC